MELDRVSVEGSEAGVSSRSSPVLSSLSSSGTRPLPDLSARDVPKVDDSVFKDFVAGKYRS